MRRRITVKEFWKTACVVGSLLAVAACSGGSGSDETEVAEPEATSGGDAAGYEGPIESTDVARGKEVFDNLCGDCHPDGGEDVGPSLIDDPHTPAQLRKQIREGSGKMRPFAERRLSGQDLEAVLAWMATVHAVK
jgi:mono/diheme cytochrome c family protein